MVLPPEAVLCHPCLRNVEKLILSLKVMFIKKEEIRMKVKQAELDCGLESQGSKYYTVIH